MTPSPPCPHLDVNYAVVRLPIPGSDAESHVFRCDICNVSAVVVYRGDSVNPGFTEEP